MARPTIKRLEIRTISQAGEEYCGWPTLARCADGSLAVGYSGGREGHICPFGRIQWIRSRDEGNSWTWPRVIYDSPIDDRDTGIIQTRSGALLITTFTSLAYAPILRNAEQRGDWDQARLDRWKAAHRRVDTETRQKELGVWMIRSTDGGVSWSRRYSCLVNSPHGPTQLADGTVFYAGKQLWQKGTRVGVASSSDDGISWTWLSDIPTRPGDRREHYHELHAVQTAGGRIVVHIRNHNPKNEREILQTHSDDGGVSWANPRAIGVWGLPSHLCRLPDGRLLMSYGYRRPPFGVQVRLGDEDGASWGEPITISDDGASSDLGYPSTVVLDQGDLLTVWYELPARSALAVLRMARWRL